MGLAQGKGEAWAERGLSEGCRTRCFLHIKKKQHAGTLPHGITSRFQDLGLKSALTARTPKRITFSTNASPETGATKGIKLL